MFGLVLEDEMEWKGVEGKVVLWFVKIGMKQNGKVD